MWNLKLMMTILLTEKGTAFHSNDM